MSSKINWLISNTLPGSLVLQSWLTKHGISPSLAQKYTTSNWLKKLSAGVYTRPGRPPEWQDVIHSLQTQKELPIHLAGISSLAYQGKAHYLQLNKGKIWIALNNNIHLPTWFKGIKEYQWHILSNSKIENLVDSDICQIEVKNTLVNTSTVELAILEILESVPKHISFEYAAELFQGMVNLSPRKVQSLLERNNSVKSNRLFLFLAHYYNHSWLKKLNENKINLGQGKRQIVKGGKLSRDYNITVPEKFLKDNNEHG